MRVIMILSVLCFLQLSVLVGGQSVKHANIQPSTSFMNYHDDDVPERFFITHEAWFNISISENKFSLPIKSERIVIGLFGDICPMTVTNFITITKGLRRASTKYAYKGSPIHRIVRDFVIQTGDFTNGDGTGGKSIYGDKFIDENHILSHRSPGWVSMANHGKDTNGSQWFITLVPARWLDGHHVAFGRVISGMDFVYELGEVETFKGTSIPKKHLVIEECGLNEITKYELTPEQLILQSFLFAHEHLVKSNDDDSSSLRQRLLARCAHGEFLWHFRVIDGLCTHCVSPVD